MNTGADHVRGACVGARGYTGLKEGGRGWRGEERTGGRGGWYRQSVVIQAAAAVQAWQQAASGSSGTRQARREGCQAAKALRDRQTGWVSNLQRFLQHFVVVVVVQHSLFCSLYLRRVVGVARRVDGRSHTWVSVPSEGRREGSRLTQYREGWLNSSSRQAISIFIRTKWQKRSQTDTVVVEKRRGAAACEELRRAAAGTERH